MSRCCKILAIVAAIGASSCTTQKRDSFDLGAARVVPINSAAAPNARVNNARLRNIQLLIAAPAALKSLDGDNIVVSAGRGSIAHLGRAQLSDRLPNVVQARLVQAFEDTSLLGGVGRPGDGLAINYQILSDIRAFGIRADNTPPMAHIELGIKIVDDRNGTVRAMRVFTNQRLVLATDNSAYAQALERAFAGVLSDIVNWTFERL